MNTPENELLIAALIEDLENVAERHGFMGDRDPIEWGKEYLQKQGWRQNSIDGHWQPPL